MGKHSWITAVLEDVRQYANKNNLPEIEAKLAEVAAIASEETEGQSSDQITFLQNSLSDEEGSSSDDV